MFTLPSIYLYFPNEVKLYLPQFTNTLVIPSLNFTLYYDKIKPIIPIKTQKNHVLFEVWIFMYSNKGRTTDSTKILELNERSYPIYKFQLR